MLTNVFSIFISFIYLAVAVRPRLAPQTVSFADGHLGIDPYC
jgi:hypothetical protein